MDKRPEWFEGENPDNFASVVRKGVQTGQSESSFIKKGRFQKKNRPEVNIDEWTEGILTGNRGMLAQAITLIESNAEHHFRTAQKLLQELLPHSGNAIRIGITGVPGAGKSTFIEAFGTFLCDLGLKVAVLAVDPSSSISGGSILGDKTRMEQLSRNPRAFIRPSPSAGKLGGVHRKTRETITLCEAAGFNVILVETVGVGQSEVLVRDMVDFFMLLVLTGAGDELQGMKKGIMELADAVLVNKADGENKRLALKTKAEYNRILHFLQPATKGWQTKAATCSAIYQEGMKDIWDTIQSFEKTTKKSGVFENRRRAQTKEWIYSMIIDQLQFSFFNHQEVKPLLPQMENEVIAGARTVTSAVEELFQAYSINKKL
ncbi:methylmalonyl Co-A mutase-associated GTPase MeaB [Cytobacillus solani]|uniref:Transporter n=1 Tax=Cytobacillus solani TaxID=1637975 RepID=A0A0Q3QQF4_9BACI|nr:methylmalonyl Co-A mutase-associated GTPase MeaB [Cytobacillus solani]KOP83369.1 transporter [Bacillus sp. FJAT-21945]KQL20393.1 transporter [Cytobacillus solani]USK53658.1 methylmalonyl Co-A mutase-associated GTPase MeaB [Cytobacillus solani]